MINRENGLLIDLPASMLEFDLKYSAFQNENAGELAEDMKTLQEDLFLQRVFYNHEVIHNPSQYPKLENAKKQALGYCVSELQHANSEKANSLAKVIKEVFSYDRYCMYSRMAGPTQAPSFELLYNTQNATAVSSFFNYLSSGLYTFNGLSHLLDFVLSYTKPYELILMTYKHNFSDIRAALYKWRPKKADQTHLWTFSDVLKRFEEIFSENNLVSNFAETWKSDANKIITNTVEEQQFFKQAQTFRRDDKSLRDIAVNIGGLAFFVDLSSIFQGSDQDAAPNFLRKLLAIHGFLVKLRVTLSKIPKEGVDAHKEKLISLPTWLDNSVIDVMCELVSKIEGATLSEAELFEDCCLFILEFVMFGCKEVLCPHRSNTDPYLIPKDILTSHLDKFLNALTTTAAQEKISTFQFLLKTLIKNLVEGKFMNQKEHKASLSQGLNYLLRTLKALLRRNVLNKASSGIKENKGFIIEIAQFAVRTILELPFLETCLNNFEIIYLLYIALQGSKHNFCLETYDFIRIYKKFTLLILELQNTNLTWLHEAPLSFQYNRTGVKLVWGYYYFAELIYCCRTNALNQKSNDLGALISDTSIFTAIFYTKIFNHSELVYTVTKFLIWLWFEDLKRRISSKYNYLDEKQYDSEFTYVLNFLEDFFQNRWENYWILPSILQLKANEYLTKKYLFDKRILHGIIASLFSGVSMTPFKANISNTVHLLESKLTYHDNLRQLALTEAVEKGEWTLINQTKQLYYEIETKSQNSSKDYKSQRELYYQSQRLCSLEFYYTLLTRLQKNCQLQSDAINEKKIEWISQPWVILYRKCVYWGGCQDINLNLFKPEIAFHIMQKHVANFVRISAETAQIKIEETDVLNGENLVNLLEHYKTHKNLRSTYFDGAFTISSLRYCHYIQFLLNHSFSEDPYTNFTEPQAKEKRQIFKNFIVQQGLTIKDFLLAAVRTFLQISENYLTAMLKRDNAESDPQRVFKALLESYTSSNFFKDYSSRVWRILYLVYSDVDKKEFEVWDDFSPIEELEKITLEDLSDEYVLAKKTFRNIVLIQMINSGLAFAAWFSVSRDRLLFVMRMMQQSNSLASIFNWQIALSSDISLFRVISKEDKENFISIIKKIAEKLQVKLLVLEILKVKEDNGDAQSQYGLCLAAFDTFIKNIKEYASQSLLLLGDVEPVANIFFEMLRALFKDVDRTTGDDFLKSSQRRYLLMWIMFQLQSSNFQFRRNKFLEQYFRDYDISPYIKTIRDSLESGLVSTPIKEEVKEDERTDTSVMLGLISSCCQYVESKELELFSGLKFSLGINFVLKTTSFKKNYSLEDRKAIFQQIIKYISSEINPERLSDARKKQLSAQDKTVSIIYEYYLRLTRALPITTSQYLLPLYLESQKEKDRKQIWELLHQVAMISYRLWKFSHAADAAFDQESGYASRLFGVLSFLTETYSENFKEGHYLDEIELRELLMIPNHSFDSGLELEALFLAQALSGYTDELALIEIKLNKRLLDYNPASNVAYKEVIKNVLDTYDPRQTAWLTEFFYSNLEFESTKAGSQLIVKRKIPNSLEPWMLKHSVGKQAPVFTHLRESVTSSAKDVIEKILESFEKAISILNQDPSSNQKMLLSWCLVHLINLADNFSHLIPYIVSRKSALKDSQGESDLEKATFIDLLIHSFKHQPYLSENLLIALLERSKDYYVGAGETDSRPIDLSSTLAYQILKSIIQAIKLVYQRFIKNPSNYLILMINNYFHFLDPLHMQLDPILKSLSKEEKSKFLKILESLADQMYSIYCNLALRNDHFDHNTLEIQPCLTFISNLFQLCSDYSIQAQKFWNESNLYFLLNQLESLQMQAQNRSTNMGKHNPLDLKNYTDIFDESESKITLTLASYTAEKNYAGVLRKSNVTYYPKIPSSRISFLQKDDVELCNQARLHAVQKSALDFRKDCLSTFISCYVEAMDTSTSNEIEKKIVKASNQQTGDMLVKLRDELEDKMLVKISSTVEKAQPIPDQKLSFESFKNKLKAKEEQKKQSEKPQSSSTNEEQKINEEIKLNEIKEVKPNKSPDANNVVKKKKETDASSVELDVGLLTEGLLEALFELTKDVVTTYLEEMLKHQKLFMEAVFIEELPHCLPNAAIDLFEILESRGKTLRRFLKRLELYSMKFFWLFLPESFKNLVKYQIPEDVDYSNFCLDTIRQTIANPDLAKYTNSSLFEVLNESLNRYNNPTSKPLKQEKPADKAADNSSNIIVEASSYIETDEDQNIEKVKLFNHSPDNIERAVSAISWLYLSDSQIEIIVLKSAVTKNMGSISLYSHLLVNPLNELRFIGSLLDLLEDSSLEKIKSLVSKHKQQIDVSYQGIFSNILYIMNWILTYQPEPVAALKAPASFINKFRLPSLNTDYPKELEHLSGFERILQLIDNKAFFENEACIESTLKFAYNYLKDAKLYIVKSPSAFPCGQFSYRMISIELAEKTWVCLMDLWKRGHIVSRSNEFQLLLKTLMKNYSFFHFVRASIIQSYIPTFKAAKEKVATAISKLTDTSKFVDQLQTLYQEIFATDLKNLKYLVDLMNQSVLIQFSGIGGRMEYNQRNMQSKGALGKWASALHAFVIELAQCQEVKELILSMLEILCLESNYHESQKSGNAFFRVTEPSLALFNVLVEFKAILVISTEIVAPNKNLSDFETGQLGEVGMTKHYSSLQRYVSRDVKEVPEVLPITMSFLQMKNAGRNIELDNIYLHSVVRISKKMLAELLRRFSGSDLAKRIFTMKFSFFQDLPQKEAGAMIRVPPSSERCITIDRKTHLLDSIRMWVVLPKADRPKYRPKISYKNEPGVDGGGLLRSWFVENTKHLFDPAFGLFKVAENARVIHPNIASKIIPEHLTYFEYAGYHVAMAIKTKSIIDVHFTKSFYKMILDRPLTLSDLEELDSALYKNLQWTLENDIDGLFQTFSYEIDLFGERFLVELDEKGADIFVTNENKELYVKLFAMAKMQKEVSLEINAFLTGFNDILPTSALQKFTPGELEAIVAGASTIDIEDMKANTSFNGYGEQFKKWFWEIIEEFNQSQRSAFLYFISGSTKVPYGGFKEQPISLNYQAASLKLPIAHTCSRSLDLPEYASKQILKEKLLKGIYEGTDSFMIS